MTTSQTEATYCIKCNFCGLEARYTIGGRSTIYDAEEHWKGIGWIAYRGRDFCSDKCKGYWSEHEKWLSKQVGE